MDLKTLLQELDQTINNLQLTVDRLRKRPMSFSSQYSLGHAEGRLQATRDLQQKLQAVQKTPKGPDDGDTLG